MDKSVTGAQINHVLETVRRLSPYGDSQLTILARALAVGRKSAGVNPEGALEQIRAIFEEDAQLVPLPGEAAPEAARMSPELVIERIAQVADRIGFQAGVGASETAGTIISVLYANPHLQERFWRDGAEIFLDGTIRLSAENGGLTFMSMDGKVRGPAELAKANFPARASRCDSHSTLPFGGGG